MIEYTMNDIAGTNTGVYVFCSSSRTREEKPHTHSFTELVYCNSGSAHHYINGVRYTLRRGDMLLITPGDIHAFTPSDKFAYTNICYPEDLCREIRSCKVSFFGAELKEVESLLLFMLSEQRGKRMSWKSIIEDYARILLSKIARADAQAESTEELDGKCREIADYIDEHLTEDLSLSELAERYFYNSSYMSRFFKYKFGCNFIEYVSRRRIDMAKELILKDELSVAQISRLVGFENRSNFYSAFTKYTCCTPSEYRKNTGVKKQDNNVK